jgi:hypothetical protein
MRCNNPVPINLAEMLLLNLNLLKFLVYVDANYEGGDPLTMKVVNRFFAERYGFTEGEADSSLPFLRQCTSLVILTPAFAFGASLDDSYWDRCLASTSLSGQRQPWFPIPERLVDARQVGQLYGRPEHREQVRSRAHTNPPARSSDAPGRWKSLEMPASARQF